LAAIKALSEDSIKVGLKDTLCVFRRL